ncbi:MAG: hypothetical protein IJZ02_06980 [Clostridia bacterium]|nr:hypothetical protein [Clostridia bacterium]
MRVIPALRYSEWTLKRKLFVYMLLLAVLILGVLLTCLILFGRTNSAAETYTDALDMQMAVFEKDIAVHFDHLAASAISMSDELAAVLEENLSVLGLSLAELSDSGKAIADVQGALLVTLRQRLLQADCSGAFVILDATVNSALNDAAVSRTGLYLQLNGYHVSDREMLLYRGSPEVAGQHGIALHRKWRLEFRTDTFPDYAKLASRASLPPESAYLVTDLITLPGTSEHALLLAIPMVGADGTFYGICGYEVSASYFTVCHAQPSKLAHLSCLLTEHHENILLTSEALCCGSADGYFHDLTADYAVIGTKGGLTHFKDEQFSYLGITRSIPLSPGEKPHLLAVMIPKPDYDRALLKNLLQIALLTLLLIVFTVSFSRYFSRRFLSPLLAALEQIKSDKRSETQSDIPEILDLIEYLQRQEREHGEAISALEMRNMESEERHIRLQAEYETALLAFRRVEEEYSAARDDLLRAQAKMDRLAYSRKTEIDPDDYQTFLDGLQTLTEAERNIFEYYLAGKSAKEILAITGIKESTLKYHNHNLLGKLGVSSRKQMLRYAEIMRHQRDTEAEE